MAALESCPKHKMIAYLEKTDGNTEFHEIIDFLTQSSIHYALTVSPVVSTTFFEQFWMSAKSKTINNVRYINGKVAGKPVTISKASIRIFLGKQLKNVHVPLDHFPINALTSKVFSFMVKKGKHFSGKVTPLFTSMLVQQTEDEGEASERPSESQPIPSPPHPKSSGRNHEGQSSSDRSLSGNKDGLTLQGVYDICVSLCTQVTAQVAEIKDLKAQIKQLKKKARPVINHHKAWLRTLRLKKQQKMIGMKKSKKIRSVSKQGRKAIKSSKGKPSVPTNTDWDDLDMDIDETLDYTLAQDKGSTEKGGSSEGTAKQQSTDKPDEGIDKPNEGTDSTKVSTDRHNEGTAKPKMGNLEESTPPTAPTTTSTPTPIVFGDDETIAEFLVSMSQNKAKQKGVEIKDAEDSDINPKDKGKKVIEDERLIKEMNEEKDPKKKRLEKRIVKETPREEDTVKPDDDSDDEHIKCLRIVIFNSTIDSEIMETKSVVSKLHKVSSPDGDYLVVYRANGYFRAFNYLIEVLHIFNRQDLFHLYKLVMKQYSEITQEDIELILWGDLKIMMESSTEENDQGDFWNNQQEWEIVRWRLYAACGVCTLELKDGTFIYMLVERRNKKDEREIVVKNKARLVAQGHTQEEGIDYDEVFTLVARIKAIRGQIYKTLFIKRDKDDILLVQIYVDDIIFGSTKKEMIKQKDDGIFISQDIYVAEILKKFDFATIKTASTLIEANKPLLKDEEAKDVDVHLYRSMIGSLMYLTASRPDIMFAVCACARFQVTPKISHLYAVKRIFRYLKGQPKLGLWYPKDSPFDLESFSDSDYAGASIDRKSTTGGCQFLGKRLISCQCKKQTIVANSTIKTEYVAAASCRRQVLWIHNQMLDYGFNFMNTKIYIDNESTITIVKNLKLYGKTKHIEIRHHFIRDCHEKRLIKTIKIHTYHNVADLLIKAFDVSRFNFLVASIGLLNL
ncbi:putative ribonuclease H-like domain-containing protein [Tanacetum coccineum]